MRVIFEASIQAGWVIATTAGLLYWGRRRGKSNPYKDGLLRYDGALCAFLGAGLRVIGDKVLQHKQLSAREEVSQFCCSLSRVYSLFCVMPTRIGSTEQSSTP